MATTINLRDFYPWYTHDEFVEVSDEVAAELRADKVYEKTHERRMRYNKTYLFDEQTENEASALVSYNDNPERLFDMMENHCRLCRALNALPEIQGRRVEAFYLLGKSVQEIADAEGVSESAVKESLGRGIKTMRKNYFNNFSKQPCENAFSSPI